MTNLEDILAEEIERQGARATPEGFKQMLTDTIGRMDNGFIRLERGSISIRDYVRSVRQQNPEFFGSESGEKPTGNLTESMRREIAERRSRGLPSDWTTVRQHMTGLTASMMDERAAARKGEVGR
jgi:hypothetical protein